ncbi:MAG: alpha/beta hydrolase [Burkholderiaceae bacterium]|nr:alpha/beta hydrolase [Burkholderiaceae bacterium]MBP8309033.1 alpha/beta hydrolase [Burkholderiaceae bacterium]
MIRLPKSGPFDPAPADLPAGKSAGESRLRIQHSVQLAYRVDGQGTPCWLLFNGASLPMQFWDGLADGLALGATVVRLDQRNVGATRADGPFSLLDVAADAAALLDHLQIEQVIVAGHAWGGRVAQVFARDYPHRVAGLVICGTGGQFPATVAPMVLQQLRESGRARDRARWESAMEAAFCAKGFSTRQPAAFRALCDLQWSQLASQAERAAASWDMRIAPSLSYWGSARAPSLLIYGTEDGNGTAANANDLAARLPGSRLHFIEQAGHFVIREQPDQVLALMREFAQSLEQGAPAR